MPNDLQIICGDDGRQIAFRGQCPKCGSTEWVPAGRVTLTHLKELGEDTLNEIRRILGIEPKQIAASDPDKGDTHDENQLL